MYPKYAQIYLARSIGYSFARGISDIIFRSEERQPKYIIRDDTITILNFAFADDSGYYMTGDFIELPPTQGRTDNLFDNKYRKILINGDELQNNNNKEIIEEAIKAALIETRQISETNVVIIKDDKTLLILAYGME